MAENLAAEQLNRYRDWHVLTSDNFARMLDIELTSELIIFMLQGIRDKSDRVISKVYRDYDKTFPQGSVVAKRFRQVFHAVNDSLADDVSQFFNSRTKFYALFVAVYDLLFGIESGLKPWIPRPLGKSSVRAIRKAGERIKNGTAPETVVFATKRTPSHVRERKTLVNYLLKGASAG